MRHERGFTLLEVVIAILVLEVGVLAAVGTMSVAVTNLARAERLERAVASSEGVLDSLAGVAGATSGASTLAGAEIEWSVDTDGVVALRALDPDGDVLFDVVYVLAAP